MTEAEWLRCSQPRRMLDYLRGKASKRKMVLFACASCRRVWDKINDARSRRAVETTERFADGWASENELQNAEEEAELACIAGDDPTARAIRAAFAAVSGSPWAVNHQLLPGNKLGARKQQASILIEVFGNPFRPVALDPAWLQWNGGTVRKMAQAIYDDRAFDRLPILADALEEATCTNRDLLDHSRSGGEHVRGCWAVDLLLGKE